jgi:hypothetical protein
MMDVSTVRGNRAAPPSRVMNSRRLMTPSSRPNTTHYHNNNSRITHRSKVWAVMSHKGQTRSFGRCRLNVCFARKRKCSAPALRERRHRSLARRLIVLDAGSVGPSCEDVLYHPSKRKDGSDRDSQREDHDRKGDADQYPKSRHHVSTPLALLRGNQPVSRDGDCLGGSTAWLAS